MGSLAFAQQQKPAASPQSAPAQEQSAPPAPDDPDFKDLKEEDETITTAKEYAFNPLQATKEIKVGDYYMKKGSFKAASLRFQEATRWNPQDADAFLKLGYAKEKLKDVKGAKAAWKKYIELAPDSKKAEELKKVVGS